METTNEKKMEFKRYSSIDRNTKIHSENYSKVFQAFMERGLGDVMCIWQQKVHGTNFGVYFNGTEFEVGKRSAFISVEDNFMGNRWSKHLDAVKPKFRELYKDLQDRYPEMEQAVFHCELAGGHYDGEGEGQIQGNTHYSKDQFLYFFDIRIFFKGIDEDGEAGLVNTIINPETSVYLFENFDILHAKIRDRGTLLELSKQEDYTNYLSQELAGGQIVESEGMVIKSVEDERLYWGHTRIVLKKINPKFEESSKSKRNNKKSKDTGAPKAAVDYVMEADRHVTALRLDKVCGNLGYSVDNFEGKAFGIVVKGMMEDVIKEMKSEEYEMPAEGVSYIQKKLSSKIAPLIRNKFL